MNLNPKPRRSDYRYKGPKVKGTSMRYELILDGAVMKYPDGREVCQPNLKGMREYRRRIQTMCERQDDTCCICKDTKKRMKPWDATFEHVGLRGLGAAFRDDRIEDEAGKEMNGAAHFDCNGEKGSKRSG